MLLSKKIRTEIKKIVRINDHILYEQYSDFPLLKYSNSEWLKENFSDWKEQKNFLPGLYNIARFLDNNETMEELINKLKAVDASFAFNKSYYTPNERFYAIKPYTTDPWSDWILEVREQKDYDKEDNLISLSKLKEFEMNYPNMIVYDGIFNNLEKKETKRLIKEKLIFKPISYEKEYFYTTLF